MKSTFMEKKETVKRNWYVIDATDVTLGRLCTKVANLLTGKGKVTYTPHIDCGDYVIVVNANKVNLTGKKLTDKKYYNHSDFPGGLRTRTAGEMIEKYSEELIETGKNNSYSFGDKRFKTNDTNGYRETITMLEKMIKAIEKEIEEIKGNL